MTEMVTSGSMSGDARRSDGLLGESGHERRRSQQAPPVLYATARVLDSTADLCRPKGQANRGSREPRRSVIRSEPQGVGGGRASVPIAAADRSGADWGRSGEAVLVLGFGPYIAERQRIAELAIRYRLPTFFTWRDHVEAGGLMSYGPDFSDLVRRGAIYVDKILKGAKPGDLPVEQLTKFELVK